MNKGDLSPCSLLVYVRKIQTVISSKLYDMHFEDIF